MINLNSEVLCKVIRVRKLSELRCAHRICFSVTSSVEIYNAVGAVQLVFEHLTSYLQNFSLRISLYSSSIGIGQFLPFGSGFHRIIFILFQGESHEVRERTACSCRPEAALFLLFGPVPPKLSAEELSSPSGAGCLVLW